MQLTRLSLFDRLAGFLGYSRRSIENPSYPLSLIWDSARTSSGVPVSHETALSLAAVWQAVSMISGDVAKLPLDLFIRGEDGSRIEVSREVPAQRVVKVRANEECNAIKFWRRFMVQALVWNNGYAYIDRNGRGEPIQLITLLSSRTYTERVNGRLIYWTHPEGGDRMPLRPDEVFHVEGLGYDGCAGADWLRHARNAVGLGLAAEGFAGGVFKNGTLIGGTLKIPEGMPLEAQANLIEGFRKNYSGDGKAFKTAILRDGVEFDAHQVDAGAAQLTELREDQVRDVARLFNLNPSRLGLSDSVSYNSKTEDAQQYLDCTLQIWLELICAEAHQKLLGPQQRTNHFFKHNTRTLVAMNMRDRMEMLSTGISWGIFSRNEARSELGLNPVEDGDAFYMPLNHAPAGMEPAEDPPPTEDESPAGNRDAVAKLQRILCVVADDGRHKAGRSPAAFVEWVDTGLERYRRQFRADFGYQSGVAEQIVFDGLLAELNQMLSETEASDLQRRAGEILSSHETRAIDLAGEIQCTIH